MWPLVSRGMFAPLLRANLSWGKNLPPGFLWSGVVVHVKGRASSSSSTVSSWPASFPRRISWNNITPVLFWHLKSFLTVLVLVRMLSREHAGEKWYRQRVYGGIGGLHGGGCTYRHLMAWLLTYPSFFAPYLRCLSESENIILVLGRSSYFLHGLQLTLYKDYFYIPQNCSVEVLIPAISGFSKFGYFWVV